jgi:alpha-glucosidase
MKNDELMRDRRMRLEEFRSISEIGVKGVKVDFFLSDKQTCIRQYIEILQDAAACSLMVNFHGCTLPRGWSKTWPNLMTMEAVRGAEMYKAHEDYPVKAPWQNTVWPFTRNVVGPMDYTPTAFSDNTYPHLTSYAHELALPVVYQSGWVHYIDAAERYLEMPEAVKEMLRSVPAFWDETRFIGGYPGKHVILARRNDKDWYVGGINGENRVKNMVLDLSFLGEGSYELLLLTDGETGKEFSEHIQVVHPGESLDIRLLPFGGFVARYRRQATETTDEP